MSKTKLLLDLVSDLRSLADSVQAVADAITNNDEAEKQQPEPVNEPAKKQITLEEVRAVLAEKSHDGFTAEIRELLQKHGASKLSEIDPSKYPSLLTDAEGLK